MRGGSPLRRLRRVQCPSDRGDRLYAVQPRDGHQVDQELSARGAVSSEPTGSDALLVRAGDVPTAVRAALRAEAEDVDRQADTDGFRVPNVRGSPGADTGHGCLRKP